MKNKSNYLLPALDFNSGLSQFIGCMTIIGFGVIIFGAYQWFVSGLISAISLLTIGGLVTLASIVAQHMAYWNKWHFLPPGLFPVAAGCLCIISSSAFSVPDIYTSYGIGFVLLIIGTIRFTYVYWHAAQNTRVH